MHKKVFKRINLTCMLQNADDLAASGASTAVTSGLLSRAADGGILFQETLPRRRDIRNARLYEGQRVSVVRRKDGRYYVLLKAFRPEDIPSKDELTLQISAELTEALKIIE